MDTTNDPMPNTAQTTQPLVMVNSVVDPQANSVLIRYLRTKFPLEILLRLVDFLRRDVLSFRATCRSVEQALLPSFRKLFFNSRRVSTSLRHLTQLKAISETRHLRDHVFSVEVRSPDALMNQDGAHEDRGITAMGIDRTMLKDAFRGLPNLTTIKVVSKAMVYGFAADHDQVFFQMVLYAAATAQDRDSPKLKTFEVLRHGGSGGGVPMFNFNLPEITLPDIKPLLGGLKHLTLAFNPDVRSGMPLHDRDSHEKAAVSYLVNFLSHTHLDSLRINMDRAARRGAEPVMLALGSKKETPALSSITDLQLGKMAVTPTVLISTIARFGSQLKSLELFRVGLIPRGAVGGDSNPWKQALTALGQNPHLSNLKHFKVDCLTALEKSEHVGFRVPGESEDSINTTPLRSYSGSDAQRVLLNLANEIVLPKREQPLDDNLDDDDEDDDNSFDDDEVDDDDADEDDDEDDDGY